MKNWKNLRKFGFAELSRSSASGGTCDCPIRHYTIANGPVRPSAIPPVDFVQFPSLDKTSQNNTRDPAGSDLKTARKLAWFGEERNARESKNERGDRRRPSTRGDISARLEEKKIGGSRRQDVRSHRRPIVISVAFGAVGITGASAPTTRTPGKGGPHFTLLA